MRRLATIGAPRAAPAADNGAAAPATWLMSSDVAFHVKNLDNAEVRLPALESLAEPPGAGPGKLTVSRAPSGWF
jgi:hypothetical protein